MKEREIGVGKSCFLIKDERIKGNWYITPIYDFVKDEGFVCWGKAKSQEGVDWLYINIESKVYSKGMYGVGLTKVVGDHAITFDEFLTIYNIYKKYEGLDVLKMNNEEQAEFDEKYPLLKMKKIIGCTELTHETLDEYIKSGWWTRKMLPWEHCGMHFEKVWGAMGRERIKHGIYKCIYFGKPYYFGLGLEEPSVSDDMLENGTWLVYTWSD